MPLNPNNQHARLIKEITAAGQAEMDHTGLESEPEIQAMGGEDHRIGGKVLADYLDRNNGVPSLSITNVPGTGKQSIGADVVIATTKGAVRYSSDTRNFE